MLTTIPGSKACQSRTLTSLMDVNPAITSRTAAFSFGRVHRRPITTPSSTWSSTSSGVDPGDPYTIARTHDADLLLVEPHLPGRPGRVRFFEMLEIVEADRQELRPRHRRGKFTLDSGKRGVDEAYLDTAARSPFAKRSIVVASDGSTLLGRRSGRTRRGRPDCRLARQTSRIRLGSVSNSTRVTSQF